MHFQLLLFADMDWEGDLLHRLTIYVDFQRSGRVVYSGMPLLIPDLSACE